MATPKHVTDRSVPWFYDRRDCYAPLVCGNSFAGTFILLKSLYSKMENLGKTAKNNWNVLVCAVLLTAAYLYA